MMRFPIACLAALALMGLLSCSAPGLPRLPGDGAPRPPLVLARPAVLCVADVTGMTGDQLVRSTPQGMRPFRLTNEEIGRIANGFWLQLTDRLAADRTAGVALTGEPGAADCLLTVTLTALIPDRGPETGHAGKGRPLPIMAAYRFADRDGRTVWEGRSLVPAGLDGLSRGSGLEDLGAQYGDEVFALLR
jgi:hypothetical protein